MSLVFPTWRINSFETLPVLGPETLGLGGFLSFSVRGGGGADSWVLGEKLLCLPFPWEPLGLSPGTPPSGLGWRCHWAGPRSEARRDSESPLQGGITAMTDGSQDLVCPLSLGIFRGGSQRCAETELASGSPSSF